MLGHLILISLGVGHHIRQQQPYTLLATAPPGRPYQPRVTVCLRVEVARGFFFRVVRCLLPDVVSDPDESGDNNVDQVLGYAQWRQHEGAAIQ